MTLRNHKIYALRSVDYESIDYTYVTTEAEAKRVLDGVAADLVVLHPAFGVFGVPVLHQVG